MLHYSTPVLAARLSYLAKMPGQKPASSQAFLVDARACTEHIPVELIPCQVQIDTTGRVGLGVHYKYYSSVYYRAVQ